MDKKEKIGCPITLGEYEKIVKKDKWKSVKELIIEAYKLFGEEEKEDKE